VSNEKDAFGKISSELNGYNISISQFKWERKGKNVFQVRCQVLIPARYSKEEIVNLFAGLDEVESFEIIQ